MPETRLKQAFQLFRHMSKPRCRTFLRRGFVLYTGVFVKQPNSDNVSYEKIGDEVRSPADSAPFEVSSSWEWRRMGDLFSNMSEPAYKKDAHISYNQGGQNGKGLRGGNIGEEPFFFEGDGAFISGDLVKPELCLRKNYMIAPAVSSPDRIGKNALIYRDYSDVFTACSSSSFAESRNPFTSRFFRFPCSRLLSSFTVPIQRMEYLAGCSSHSFRIFIASQAAWHARSSPVLSVAHSPVIRLVITARMEALRISCR